MAFYKVIFSFTGGKYGWSEIFYREGSNLTVAGSFTDLFFAKFMQPRSRQCSLNSIRVSEVSNNRNTTIIQQDYLGGSANALDVQSTAAILTLSAPSTGAVRHLWLRGIPDVHVNRSYLSAEDVPDPLLSNAIDRYINGVATANLCIRSLTKLTTPPNSYSTVRSIAAVKDAGYITLTFANVGALPTDGNVILSQFNPKDWPGLKGVFKGTRVTDMSFSVPYNWHADGTFPVAKGRTRPASYQYGPITTANSGFLRFGSRDTGPGPSVGRGRRTGQRIRLV